MYSSYRLYLRHGLRGRSVFSMVTFILKSSTSLADTCVISVGPDAGRLDNEHSIVGIFYQILLLLWVQWVQYVGEAEAGIKATGMPLRD